MQGVSRFAILFLTFAEVLLAGSAVPSTIPFKMHGHLVIVKGQVQELGALNFVIDTGTTRSLISGALAGRLKLQTQPAEIVVLGTKREEATTTVASLEFAGIEFRDVHVGVASLSCLGKSPPIDALIGVDLLRQANLCIDYETRAITFGAVPLLKFSLAFYGKLPFVLVPVFFDGEPFRLLLDTGSPDVILYKRAVEGRFKARRYHQCQAISYLGGRATVQNVSVKEVRLGAARWESHRACLLDVQPAAGQPVGVLGVSSLGLKRLSLDFDASILSWE